MVMKTIINKVLEDGTILNNFIVYVNNFITTYNLCVCYCQINGLDYKKHMEIAEKKIHICKSGKNCFFEHGTDIYIASMTQMKELGGEIDNLKTQT